MNTKIEQGFSLLELLVVISIGGILLASALPAVGEYLRNNRITSQTNNLVATINFARGEAITRNQNVFISALDLSGAWGKGWEVWVDGRQDGDNPCTNTNLVNRTREDCESLRVFDYTNYATTYPSISTAPATLETISGANLSDANYLKSTLMFRGGDGSLALGNGTGSINILICDSAVFGDKSKLRPGRQLNISRTGRISLVNDAVDPNSCP